MASLSNLTFPVIRGVQAGREYFVSMWTFRLMSRISLFNEDEVPAEMRAQRILNKARIPEIRDYILDNPKDYVFSAITASISARVQFEPLSQDPDMGRIGRLLVPSDADYIINDGQHRRQAILEALKVRPELANETIPVVFFLDVGLERSQQMFADLNRYAIRPSRSIGLFYDHRNEKAKLARMVIMNSELFREIVDFERSSLSPRSRALFTLSAFYNASADLVTDLSEGDVAKDANLVRDFWECVAVLFPMWTQVREGKLSAGEVREGYIHTHGIALQSIARAGNALMKAEPSTWHTRLRALRGIDWSRRNPDWEGRAMLGGRLAKTESNLLLTTAYIKRKLGLSLKPEENLAEHAAATPGSRRKKTPALTRGKRKAKV
jgi:DNA sulfur modification protein DndB